MLALFIHVYIYTPQSVQLQDDYLIVCGMTNIIDDPQPCAYYEIGDCQTPI